MAINRSIVEELWQSAHYRAVVAEIEKMAPCVPRFSYENQTNLETIKGRLVEKQFHETVMRILKPETEK